MRLRISLVLVALCLAVGLLQTSATKADTCYSATDTCYVCRNDAGAITELDLGICDTVRIGCPVCVNFTDYAVGDSFAIPIYVYSTNAIGAFTLGFHHDGQGLAFGGPADGWDPVGGALKANQWGGIQWAVDDVAKTGLMGWIDLSSTKPIDRNTTSAAKLFGTIYMVMTEQIQQTIRFDSSYVPPSGPFVLVCRDSTPSAPNGKFYDIKLRPKFVICKEIQSPPCDINLPVADVNTPALPQKFELQQNVPNPFNPSTVINCAVPRPSQLKVEVFNVVGQRVKTLADEFCKAGYKRVEWDGTDDNGTAVASGVYLYRMTAGDFSETKKMLLLK